MMAIKSLPQIIRWPSLPEYLSFSTVNTVETCALRWALLSADYPDIWDRRGYPPTTTLSSMEGIVLHLAAEKIVLALLDSGACTLTSENSVKVIRGLGGFSGIIRTSIAEAVRRQEENPRVAPHVCRLYDQLLAKVPIIRPKLQSLMSRINLARTDHKDRSLGREVKKEEFTALQAGTYTEVTIKSPELKWQGVVDLLTLGNDHCEIRDFKSGDPDPTHVFQIRLYALLWARDRRLNPSHKLATRLVLSYESGDMNVPAPDKVGILELENEAKRKAGEFKGLLKEMPPKATISDHCKFCQVRHLCEEYWTSWPTTSAVTSNWFGDIELRLLEPHNDTSWKASCTNCIGVGYNGSSVILRNSNVELEPELSHGKKLRILNANITLGDIDFENETSTLLATAGLFSESFFLG